MCEVFRLMWQIQNMGELVHKEVPVTQESFKVSRFGAHDQLSRQSRHWGLRHEIGQNCLS